MGARDVAAPLAGNRVRYGNGWAIVARVYDDGAISLLPETENALVMVPPGAFTQAAMKHTSRRVRAAIGRSDRIERRNAFQPARERLNGQRAQSPSTDRRARPRERRPSPRRTVRSSSSASRDGPQSDEDPEPDLANEWRGILAASVRMSAHVLRRLAAERTA